MTRLQNYVVFTLVVLCAQARRLPPQNVTSGQAAQSPQELPSNVTSDFPPCANIQFESVVPVAYLGTTAAPMSTAVSPRLVGGGIASASAGKGPTIGFTPGGARGVDNFRRNIDEDYLPLPQDVTYEGIFNEYFFDIQGNNTCDDLFCPVFSMGVSPDPIYPESGNELYLAVGLDSGLQDFGRKKLNVVVLVDISGSMDSLFDRYYYDGLELEDSKEAWKDTKMTVANKAVIDMLKHLNEDDRLSIVTFESSANVEVDSTKVSQLYMGIVQEKVGSFAPTGGTNMEAGYRLATEQVKKCYWCIQDGMSDYENRIIMLSDAQASTRAIMPLLAYAYLTPFWYAQPNTYTQSDTLAGLVQQRAEENIFTSIIGVGLDFNSELIEILTKTRGANYYNVFSPSQFRKKMDEEFDYMVTPLVFDLKIEIVPASFNEGNGWQVIKVYGSPDVDGGLNKEGTFFEVNTLFPTPKTEEGIKGGVVLLKMFKPDANISLTVKITYKDRDTLQTFESTVDVDVLNSVPDTVFFGSTGVEKAILLARYVDLLRGWIVDQREVLEKPVYSPEQEEFFVIPNRFCGYYPKNLVLTLADGGCSVAQFVKPYSPILPFFEIIIEDNSDRWERTSLPVTVSNEQGQVFYEFLKYMNVTIISVGDESLIQEVDLLNKLIEVAV
eukprot:TRINITY_DN1053_c0_g1_i5.p1 TRINITY_DN1053_c0_g1~~TRINITY_DN1053_c0_g1_i5.p1  ORF type:complete len:666 (-),score=80.88 TRINITY_DN1053_c0_g1_i5:323-2320(-)